MWQRGVWLLIDRNTEHITQVKLPDFDPYYWDVSWCRDYAAYCGVADDGQQIPANAAQITTKKPIYKKAPREAGRRVSRRSLRPAVVVNAAKSSDVPPEHREKLSVDVNGRFVDVTPDMPGQE